MMHHLEVLASGKEGPGYQISPKLLNSTVFLEWRRNLVHSGTNEHRQRMSLLVGDKRVREALDLNVLEGNHGS